MVEEMGSLRSAGFVDPGWEHGIAQDERKKKVRCNYCAKIVSGGIYRLKQHLARLSGEVTYCDKAPEEVFLKMRENLEGGRFDNEEEEEEQEEDALAKLAIKSNHDDDVRKYGHFWSVIDNRWNSLFHHPLYLAAYFLNPSYRYRPDFVAHPDVVRGLNSCLVRLEPDNGRRISASMQVGFYYWPDRV
ncbi:hypothetical protein C3L33_12539, partial [Rhododendron williamsianum]